MCCPAGASCVPAGRNWPLNWKPGATAPWRRHDGADRTRAGRLAGAGRGTATWRLRTSARRRRRPAARPGPADPPGGGVAIHRSVAACRHLLRPAGVPCRTVASAAAGGAPGGSDRPGWHGEAAGLARNAAAIPRRQKPSPPSTPRRSKRRTPPLASPRRQKPSPPSTPCWLKTGCCSTSPATAGWWRSCPSSRRGCRHIRGTAFRLSAGATLTLIESSRAGAGALHNPVFDIALAPGARLTHVRIVEDDATAFHLAAIHADVAAGATYDAFTLHLGGRIARVEKHVQLAGAGAAAHLNGAQIVSGARLRPTSPSPSTMPHRAAPRARW